MTTKSYGGTCALAALVGMAVMASSARAVTLVDETFNYANSAELQAGGWLTGAQGTPAFANSYFFTGAGSNWISSDANMQPPPQTNQTLLRLGNAVTFRELNVTLTEDWTITANVAIAGYSRSIQIGLGDSTGAGFSLQWNAGQPSAHMGNGFLAIMAQANWSMHSPNEANVPGTAQLTTAVSGKTPPTAFALPLPVPPTTNPTTPLSYTPNDTFLGYTELKLTWSNATGELKAFQDNAAIPDDMTQVLSTVDHDFFNSFTRLYVGGGTNAFVDSIKLETNQDVTPPAEPGDFDLDGDVDGNDFLKWQRGEAPTTGSAIELELWKANFGPGSVVAAASAPEPASITLAVGLAGLAGVRRRSRR